MIGNPDVDGVKVGTRFPIHLDNLPSFHAQSGLRIIGAVGDDQTSLWPRFDKGFLINIAFSKYLKAF